MLLSRNVVENLDRTSLIQFLSLKVPEGAGIDYKEGLSGDSSREAYKEFLKDITAFANAHGGLLFIGTREPSDDYSAENQIVGITEGELIAQNLERVAANSIDPRIPGLIINPIPVGNDRHVIVVCIPPSLIRPHMVNYRSHRTFYIRHSESSVPMTTHEIRDTVLNTATSEGRANAYAINEEEDALEYIIGKRPAFLLQAIPLMPIIEPWDVLSEPAERVIRGVGRNTPHEFNFLDLASEIQPKPTIKGVLGCDQRESPKWQTEVHRNGFVQAIYMDIQHFQNNDPNIFTLHDGYIHLFRAFCDICTALWQITQTDIPYLFRNKYINAENTNFFMSPPRRVTGAYNRRLITWPVKIRQVGEPLDDTWRDWAQQLFHAFGINWQVPE